MQSPPITPVSSVFDKLTRQQKLIVIKREENNLAAVILSQTE
jgi:hypothetical protein